MTAITHLAVGAALGSFTDSRSLSFLLGLVGHVPLDLVPHYEFEKFWVDALAVVAILSALLVAGLGGTGIFWGALGAVLPDAENLLWRAGVLPGDGKIFPGHSRRLSRIFPHGRTLGPRHALTQVAIVCASVAIVVAATRSGAGS